MPYLNWKEQAGLKQRIGPLEPQTEPRSVLGSGPLRLTLELESAPLAALLPLLREVLSADAPSGTELRLDLPRNWVVFWKRREGESRLLIAHPQNDEWVATAALSAEHGNLLLERLEGLGSGDALNLGELGATGGVTNLEITLARL